MAQNRLGTARHTRYNGLEFYAGEARVLRVDHAERPLIGAGVGNGRRTGSR
jgi:hypothetical protein